MTGLDDLFSGESNSLNVRPLDNRWGMDDPAIQRAKIEEITEEDVVEEDFHDAEEIVQGLELSETE